MSSESRLATVVFRLCIVALAGLSYTVHPVKSRTVLTLVAMPTSVTNQGDLPVRGRDQVIGEM